MFDKTEDKKIHSYDLFCLLEKKKVEKIVNNIKGVIDDPDLNIKKERFDPIYKVKGIEGEHQYITFLFKTDSVKLKKLEKEVLHSLRYILLNTEKRRNRTKLNIEKLQRKQKIEKEEEKKQNE